MDDPNVKDWENQWYGSGGGAGVMISTVVDPSLRKWEGKNLVEIGKAMGKDPRDAAMDLVIADQARTDVIISIMREDDVQGGAVESDAVDRHRLGRARGRWTVLGIEIASACLGIVPARPRQIRA